MVKIKKKAGNIMFTMFLNKAMKRKVVLFKTLENAPALTESKEDLMNKLELSEFLTNKAIDELNDDFYQFGLDHEFQIVTDGIFVTLNQRGMATSEDLIDHYLDTSVSFSMLRECFFNRFFSVNEFAIDHYFSHTFAYKEFKQLKQILATFEIEITKEFQLIGNERSLREFMLLTFLKSYPDDATIFPKEVQEPLADFDEIFAPSERKEQTAHAEMKRKHYLGTVIYRMQHGYFFNDYSDDFFKREEFQGYLKKLCSWLRTFVIDATEETIRIEAESLLCFLIAEEWIVIDEGFIAENHPFIFQLNQNFIQEVKKVFPAVATRLAGLSIELTNLHCQLLTFPITASFQYTKLDVAYFLETYPEYFNFCRAYLEQNKQRPVLWEAKEFLFYRYLLLLVITVPLKEILPPIKLCIDFSFGKNYNQMIQQNIEKICELNVAYQKKADETTQLILSDMQLNCSYEADHIIWLAPPRPVDWANFTKKILQIRQDELMSRLESKKIQNKNLKRKNGEGL